MAPADPGDKVASAPETLHRRGESLERHRSDVADPRSCHQTLGFHVLTRLFAELPIEIVDLHGKTVDLLEQNGGRPPDFLRQRATRIFECRYQPADMCWSLRSNDAELRQVATQRVDRLRARVWDYAENHLPELRRSPGATGRGGTAEAVNAERLLLLYAPVADAPAAIPRLRRFVLDLAVRERLLE